jgi:hypothetical protein
MSNLPDIPPLRGYTTLIWHFLGEIYWKLTVHEKNRKCWFVDLSLILRKSTSQIIFDHYTNRYSIVTRWHFPNCKIYLLPDGISNWAQIFTDHVTVVCQSFKTSFYLSGDWTILERQITDDFSQFRTSKSISSEDIFAKWLKFLSSILQNICKRLKRAFLQFPAKTRNMIFLVIFQKISEKKVLRFFRK